MENLNIIMNRKSGTVLRLGEEAIENLLREHLDERIVTCEFLDSAQIPGRLEELAAMTDHALLVGGGDGTAVTAADILAKHKTPFGILPLGTMNLLAQDLGSAQTFEETIARFEHLKHDEIDAGTVNGKLFLCSAVVGFVPEGAVAREAVRENVSVETLARFLGTVARGMGGDTKQTLFLKSKEGDEPYTLHTTSLIISNNSYVEHPTTASERFFRTTLTDGKLGIYSASPRDMMDGLKMALSLWQGDWQDHESVMAFEAKQLIVEAEDKNILVSLDGEPLEMQSPLHFSIRPKSVPVLRMELKAA